MRPQQMLGVGMTSTFYYGDMVAHASGGDGTPDNSVPGNMANGIGYDTSHKLMAVAEDLYPWTNPDPSNSQGIDFFAPHPADLHARGLRLGHNPVNIDVRATLPNYTSGPVLAHATVRLDPSVNLIPIEVVILQSPTYPNQTYAASLPGQLHLWDQTQDITNYFQGSTQGQISVTSRTFVGWQNPQSAGTWEQGAFIAYSSPQQYYTPDSVWRECGVQFRMVNYFRLTVDDHHNLVNANDPFWDKTSDGDTPCNDVRTLIKADPRHVPGIPIVVFLQQYNAGGLEFARTVGNQVAPYAADPAVCTPLSAPYPNILAHELGHAATLDDCNNCACTSQMMCLTHGGLPGPDVIECAAMHNFSSRFTQFWQ